MTPRVRPYRAFAVLSFTLFLLPGCSLLPQNGPSMSAVESGATGERGSYSLVELDARTNAIIDTVPDPAFAGLGAVSSTAPVDRIGVGDGLSVTIFDRGSDALFGGGPAAAAAAALGGGASLSAGNIPKVFVDSQGNITIPYAGQVHVAGLTTPEAAVAVQDALKGKAIQPQVIVSIVDNISNSVTVIGEARSPGRYGLTTGSDHILDVLAMAGGPTHPPTDMRVEVMRHGKTASIPMEELLNHTSENVRLAPRDQIRLIYVPRKFSTFGALMRSEQITIDDATQTLAGALGQAGGLDPNSANASSVLLFRFERPEVARALSINAPVSAKGVPIVYHLNMRDPEEWFVANRFQVRSNDLIYVPQSNYVEMQKFLAIVGSISSVAYNLRVTSQVVK